MMLLNVYNLKSENKQYETTLFFRLKNIKWRQFGCKMFLYWLNKRSLSADIIRANFILTT